MALTPDELIVLAPDLQRLAKLIGESLKKDEDGKVRISKEEGKELKKLIVGLSLKIAKEALD